jgi:hypothetical protein
MPGLLLTPGSIATAACLQRGIYGEYRRELDPWQQYRQARLAGSVLDACLPCLPVLLPGTLVGCRLCQLQSTAAKLCCS